MLGFSTSVDGIDRLRIGWLKGLSFIRRGTTRAEDAHGTPAQRHISPSILVYEDYLLSSAADLSKRGGGVCVAESVCGKERVCVGVRGRVCERVCESVCGRE